MNEKADTGMKGKIKINILQEDYAHATLLETENSGKKNIVLLIRSLATDYDSRIETQIIQLIHDLIYQETLPSHVIFSNDAVRLVLKDSPVEKALTFLYQHEVEIDVSADSIKRYLKADAELYEFAERVSVHEMNAILFSADLTITY